MMEKGYTLHFKGDSGIIYNKKGKFFVIEKIKKKKSRRIDAFQFTRDMQAMRP